MYPVCLRQANEAFNDRLLKLKLLAEQISDEEGSSCLASADGISERSLRFPFSLT